MISKRNGLKELTIFWDFKKDMSLPKFKSEKTSDKGGMTFNSVMNEGAVDSESWGSITVSGNRLSLDRNGKIIYPTWYNELIRYIKSLFKKKEKVLDNSETIIEFFINFSDKTEHLELAKDMAEHYNNALKQAEKMGQVALSEKIIKILEISKVETRLIMHGLTTFISESQLIDFYESTANDKHLKLDYIKNFARIIPSDIVDLKEKLDQEFLFDNYVILHYDPNNTGVEMTEKEKELKKDPILFGLLENSTKLYYIGDWKDEFCDLTLDKLLVELKEEALTINNESVKSFINSGGEFKPKRIKVKPKKKAVKKKQD